MDKGHWFAVGIIIGVILMALIITCSHDNNTVRVITDDNIAIVKWDDTLYKLEKLAGD